MFAGYVRYSEPLPSCSNSAMLCAAGVLGLPQGVNVPEGATIVPSELAKEGWKAEGVAPFEPRKGCGRSAQCIPACNTHDLDYEVPVVGSGRNRTRLCRTCDCAACSTCGEVVMRWTSPSGQTLESLRVQTDPPFVFAYNPLDTDMVHMVHTLAVEPRLTRVWHELTWQCCAGPDGLIVDVGGNYGWYTLYSLALGCSVVVFEPVPAYQDIMRLGLWLNPGFSSRVTIYGNVVYDTPGVYDLRVPIPVKRLDKLIPLGMTGMGGRSGYLKTVWSAKANIVKARSLRIDDVVQRNICLMKADVEGYEPQVFHTAAALLGRYSVPALQLELTKTKDPNQTCAAINMLKHFGGPMGFKLRQVMSRRVHDPLPYLTNVSWRTAPSEWDRIDPFPSRPGMSITAAYRSDFRGFSTNLVGIRPVDFRYSGDSIERPALECTEQDAAKARRSSLQVGKGKGFGKAAGKMMGTKMGKASGRASSSGAPVSSLRKLRAGRLS
mgnify:CR=1 FL=1